MAACADLVITTGGISVGEEDHVKPALLALGGDIYFSGVAIKPGKPVSFGLRPGGVLAGPAGQSVVCLRDLAAFRNGAGRQIDRRGRTGCSAPRRHGRGDFPKGRALRIAPGDLHGL